MKNLGNQFSIFAGIGYGHADGDANKALFRAPEGIAVDKNGNLYVTEYGSSVIRKISPDGQVRTFAGKSGEAGYSDGKGNEARFYMPIGIAVDGKDNIYVADADYDGKDPGNCTIRKISTNGKVTTLAGILGVVGEDDGRRKQAKFKRPVGILASINIAVFEAYVIGFISGAKQNLTEIEIKYLALSAQYMTFIIGLRFLADYLNGDTYYKTEYDNHNLIGARAQFKFVESKEENELTMIDIIYKAIRNCQQA